MKYEKQMVFRMDQDNNRFRQERAEKEQAENPEDDDAFLRGMGF